MLPKLTFVHLGIMFCFAAIVAVVGFSPLSVKDLEVALLLLTRSGLNACITLVLGMLILVKLLNKV